MQVTLITMLIKSLLALVTPELLKTMVDAMLDVVEDYVENSPNKVDDAILPVVKMIRMTFDIPDNDAPKAAARQDE